MTCRLLQQAISLVAVRIFVLRLVGAVRLKPEQVQMTCVLTVAAKKPSPARGAAQKSLAELEAVYTQ
jgi:hypothetical protein